MLIFFHILDIKGVNWLGFNQIVNMNFIAVENRHRKTFIASRGKTEIINNSFIWEISRSFSFLKLFQLLRSKTILQDWVGYVTTRNNETENKMQAVFNTSEGITMIECMWSIAFMVFKILDCRVKIRHSCLASKMSFTTIYCQWIINELFVFSMTFIPPTHRSRVYRILIYGFS